jgi:hypothetical protein
VTASRPSSPTDRGTGSGGNPIRGRGRTGRYAGPDGTFGNRYDDPEASYRVLYASSHRVGAFVETLARFRPELEALAELEQDRGR